VFIRLTTEDVQVPTFTGYTPNPLHRAFRLDSVRKLGGEYYIFGRPKHRQ
jgi:hypothetical protein